MTTVAVYLQSRDPVYDQDVLDEAMELENIWAGTGLVGPVGSQSDNSESNSRHDHSTSGKKHGASHYTNSTCADSLSTDVSTERTDSSMLFANNDSGILSTSFEQGVDGEEHHDHTFKRLIPQIFDCAVKSEDRRSATPTLVPYFLSKDSFEDLKEDGQNCLACKAEPSMVESFERDTRETSLMLSDSLIVSNCDREDITFPKGSGKLNGIVYSDLIALDAVPIDPDIVNAQKTVQKYLKATSPAWQEHLPFSVTPSLAQPESPSNIGTRTNALTIKVVVDQFGHEERDEIPTLHSNSFIFYQGPQRKPIFKKLMFDFIDMFYWPLTYLKEKNGNGDPSCKTYWLTDVVDVNVSRYWIELVLSPDFEIYHQPRSIQIMQALLDERGNKRRTSCIVDNHHWDANELAKVADDLLLNSVEFTRLKSNHIDENWTEKTLPIPETLLIQSANCQSAKITLPRVGETIAIARQPFLVPHSGSQLYPEECTNLILKFFETNKFIPREIEANVIEHNGKLSEMPVMHNDHSGMYFSQSSNESISETIPSTSSVSLHPSATIGVCHQVRLPDPSAEYQPYSFHFEFTIGARSNVGPGEEEVKSEMTIRVEPSSQLDYKSDELAQVAAELSKVAANLLLNLVRNRDSNMSCISKDTYQARE
jgi:hypothetical protein